MRLLRRAARLLSTLLLALTVLLLLSVTLGPRLLNYRTATMLTSSMSPAIDAGDVIVNTPLALADVRVGHVLTYHIPVDDRRVVSHRVVEVQRPGPGIVNIRTKGDANAAVDPWTAALTGDTVWQVRAVVPKAGTAIRGLRTPLAQTVLTTAVPLLVVCWLLLGIWRPAKPAKPAEPAESAEPADNTEPAALTRSTDLTVPAEFTEQAELTRPTVSSGAQP